MWLLLQGVVAAMEHPIEAPLYYQNLCLRCQFVEKPIKYQQKSVMQLATKNLDKTHQFYCMQSVTDLSKSYRKESSCGRSRTAATKSTRRECAAIYEFPSSLQFIKTNREIHKSSSSFKFLGGIIRLL